ncbi:MAG: molybdopterin cofactor-binding domain-containing protein, partial [Pseudomonadota bacterium]
IRLVSPSQGPVWLAQKLAEALGEQTQAVHVLTFDVGGAFGCRLPLYPEHVLMAALARHIQKPLAWVASRSESMLSDTQARDIAFQARMALDRHGLIQALAIKAEANFGAYASAYAAGCIADGTCKTLGQAYQIPAFSFASEGFFTAQTPVDAFRGAGKPESTLLIERLIDKAARLLDLDPVELRRRNVIPADALPKLSQTGFAMDKVDFADLLDQANALAIRYGGRNLPADHGSWLYGRGHALAIHFTGGAKFDQARIIALPDGRFELVCGLMSSGQGHETTFAQLAANELGVDPAAIRIIEGDSHRTSLASMTGGSNAMTVGAPAIMMATNALLDLMRTRAAREFEAGEDDIRYVKESQRFEVIGSDLALPMGRLVQLMHDEYGQDQIGTGLHEACCGEGISAGDHVTMPTLALFCDVRLDLETGAAQLIASYGAYDVGRVLNRTIVEGQLHGAIFQGYSWALGETVHYDEGGQLLTGSLMDYPLARADQAGPIHLVDGRSGQMMDGDHLAMKGVGELGTVAAPAALVNAIGAALGHHDWPLPACSETLLMAMKKRRDHG